MTYNDLITLYFDRSASLQWYWTLYVVVLGGLLAFSSLRQRPDTRSLVLILILYCCFAYKNAGALVETNAQRNATLEVIQSVPLRAEDAVAWNLHPKLRPTLVSQSESSIQVFHLTCDVLTVLVLVAMERRRVRWAKSGIPSATA